LRGGARRTILRPVPTAGTSAPTEEDGMGALDGKSVIVTGAAHGMGRSHARRLHHEGALVTITDIREDLPDDVTALLGDRLQYVHQDVASGDDWDRVVGAASDRYGRVDGLVNNAAVYPPPTPIDQVSTEVFERTYRINVVGTWLGIQAVVAPMRQAGSGSIVNISSLAGLFGIPGMAAYGTSKWAVRGLTKYAAQDLGPAGIRVNSVHPGAIADTGMFQQTDDPDLEQRRLAGTPLGRVGRVDEVSSLVVFLLSDQSSYISGVEHTIDGGSAIW
jgi:3alpha(or 20beta)-hydroxysteroid dehydrogenase